MSLQRLTNEQGYLKAGFLGFPKSGKTYTSVKLAIGTIKLFKLDGPVALFDTESGSNYVAEMIKAETGKDLLGVRARSFDALMQFARDCIAEKVSVAIIDSVSHPWAELMESYLVQLNEKRKAKNWAPLSKLEFQHWSSVKSIWEQWPTFFLNSPLHIIVCGRAGFIFEMEKDEETGRKELVKTGIKMRVESNFGFEPSLLVEMEREQIPDNDGGFKIVHRATVLGDRFAVLDAASAVNPGFEFFLPHVQRLNPGSHSTVTMDKTETGADVEGNVGWDREKQARTILCEEIQGAIVSVIPGLSAEDKKRKADLLQKVFGTRSWTAIENMQSAALREAMPRLNQELGIEVPPEAPDAPEDQIPGAEVPSKPEDICTKIRQLLHRDHIVENVLLGYLQEIGTLEGVNESLEEANKRQPALLPMVLTMWKEIADKINDALGRTKT
jgi:hypothetical protein